MPTVIRTPDELSADWLAEVLGRPGLEIAGVAAIGTGQMSQNHRVTFADGSTVVIKLASDDATSRATGAGMGAYAREVSFYSELAGRIDHGLAECFYAEIDPAEGWFTLVLADIAGAVQGDQIAGCTVAEAELALRTLARVHAPVLGNLHVGALPWLNQESPLNQALVEMLLPGFLERYAGRVSPEHAEVCQRFAGAVDAWGADRRAPVGLVHGDYRLDNLLFDGDSCTVVDWQTVSWGPAMLDAAYFIGGGLSLADRREHERALFDGYLDELGGGLSRDECWDEYRRHSFHNILMAVVAAMVVERTERGDDMFMTVLERSAQQVLDLDALDLLPAAGSRPAPLRPDPSDEGRHAPGPEPTWNESWYFDAVSDDGSLGVYVRLGRVPNRGSALYTAAIVGPGRPAVMLVDDAAPLPEFEDDAQAIDRDGLRATQVCEAPLERFRVTLAGVAAAHADESAPLRAEAGEPVDVELDLVWTTAGVPYQWRLATRYEIPCRVEGTVRVGGEEIAFTGVGQRDHSWGARDWWANDWMWNALHLDDGTHTHTVTLPDMPGLGVGYIQRGDEVEELQAATTQETVADNGLITAATVTSGDLVTEIAPVAFGALRLVAPDGRVTHFPRAMCTVTTPDGRTGSGWIEFNRNQP